MGKNSGLIQLEGSVGNVTFFKTKYGPVAKIKAGPSKKKIETDEAFRKTRENNSEFGRAGNATRLFRKAFRTQLKRNADRDFGNRLHELMVRVIQADLVNPRGQRNVVDGEATMLQGFEFNNVNKLDAVFAAPYASSIDRVTGEMKISIAPFIPNNMISAPTGTTHFQLMVAGASIDFEKNEFVLDSKSSGDLLWNGVATQAIDLVTTVTPNSTHPLFLLLGIEFYEVVNGFKSPSNRGSLAVVMVNGE
jgi:hypothetical protein